MLLRFAFCQDNNPNLSIFVVTDVPADSDTVNIYSPAPPFYTAGERVREKDDRRGQKKKRSSHGVRPRSFVKPSVPARQGTVQNYPEPVLTVPDRCVFIYVAESPLKASAVSAQTLSEPLVSLASSA